MIVRQNKKTDWPSMYRLARTMHDESPAYRDISFSPEAIEAIEQGILLGQFVCFIAERDDEILGFFIGGLTPFFFSKEFFAFDLALFVDPAARGGAGVALKLVTEFITWANKSGAREIRVASTTGVNTEQYSSFMKKLGLVPCGIFYGRQLVPFHS
jgi:GNAT superfamily N-acetyltransferase